MVDQKGYVVLTMKYEREGNKWVGTCVELGTSTYENTLKQVIESLDALVLEHLNVLEELGARERFFTKWGIQFHAAHEKGSKGSIESHFRQQFDSDWVRFITSALKSHGRTAEPHFGPFYQPGIFPISPSRPKRGVPSLVGV